MLQHRVAALVGTCVVAVAGGAILASPALAARFKAQVVAAPYAASASRSALPVLLSKDSARHAHLRSQVGVVIIPRRSTVPGPDGPLLPRALRVGDRLTLRAHASRAVQRSTYVRLEAVELEVTRRGDELSTAELQDLLLRTRQDLAQLSGRVDGLAASTQLAVAALSARVDALQAQLDAMRRDLDDLRQRTTALESSLDATARDLHAQVAQVRADLQPQLDALAGSIAALSGVLGDCTTAGTVLGRLCTLEAAFGATDPTAVAALSDRVGQLSSALTATLSTLTGLSLRGDLPATLTGPVTSALGQLAGLQATVASLGGNVTTLSGSVSTLDATLAGVQTRVDGIGTQLGTVDAGALAGQVANLIADLGADPTGLNPAALSATQAQIASLGGTVAAIQTQLGSVNVPALSTTVAGIQGQISTIDGTLAGICAAVNGQALPVIGVLPLVGDVAGDLTAQLTDACP